MPRPLAADLSAVHTFPSVFDRGTTVPTVDDQTAILHAATEVAAETAVTEPTITFGDLGLPARLVAAVATAGISTPFPIQSATIPDGLAGRDVLGRGQTGSGKTLAFGLPMLATLAAGKRSRAHHPKGLILVPTRELAMQVADALAPLGRSLGIHLQTAVGGVRYDRQIAALQRGVDIIVATPGRLGDLIERGACSLDEITVTVLDEADQMADMGFLPEVTQLLMLTPQKSQRLLFSATLDSDVDSLVKKFLTDPVTHEIDPARANVATMEHQLLLIPPAEKFAITAAIANRAGRTLMFAKTQLGVDRLVDELLSVGVRTAGLHGGKTQAVRTRTLAEFREGRMDVLVATDVAARGIHVDGISLVVHVDPPKDAKDYLHRAGRTARAGEAGTVVTLVLPRQRRTTFGMLDRAEVAANRAEVRLQSPVLAQITGARPPSGQPVTMEQRRRDERPRRDSSYRGDRRDSAARSDRRDGGFRRDSAPRSDRGYRPDAQAGDRANRIDGAPRGERARFDRAARTDRHGQAPQAVRHERTPRTERTDAAPRAEHGFHGTRQLRAELSDRKSFGTKRDDRSRPQRDARPQRNYA